jgi:hypothetical protein
MNVRWMHLFLFCFALTACSQLARSLGSEGELATVTGTVESVDISPMAYDGPAELRIRSQEHGLIRVYVSACMGPCALDAVNALSEIRPGESWRATGEVSGDHELALYDPVKHVLVPAASGN